MHANSIDFIYHKNQYIKYISLSATCCKSNIIVTSTAAFAAENGLLHLAARASIRYVRSHHVFTLEMSYAVTLITAGVGRSRVYRV